MKTKLKYINNKQTKIVALLSLYLSATLFLSACGLNSSDETPIQANLRGASRGGSVTSLSNGGKAIDLQVGRPPNTSAKWTYLQVPKANLEAFLSLSEGQSVTIDPQNYNYVDAFFWGNFSSTEGALKIGNSMLERQFFNSLDPNKFSFELTIWDYYTNGTNAQGQKYDYLGYAYFGRGTSQVQAGQLSQVKYIDNGNGNPQLGMRFTDSLGDIVFEATMNRSTLKMSGMISFRAPNQNLILLGNFQNLNVCEMFKCAN